LCSSVSYIELQCEKSSEGNTFDFHYDIVTFSKRLNEVENVISSAPESNGSQSINGTYLGAHWEGFMSSITICSPNGEICSERLVIILMCKFHCRLL